MAQTSSKKYYWLRLKDDFFQQKEIKKLRKIAGGDTYTIIYLKMLLIAMKQDNKLYWEGIEEEFEEELALQLDEEVDNVKMTVAYLKAQNLIEQLTEEDFLLTKCSDMVGKETAGAERVRQYRQQKKLVNNNELLQCNNDVTKCNTEKEIEKDIEKEIHINTYIVKILDYLNLKINSNYRSNSQKTKILILARLKEGFVLEDFKTVIDKKSDEWLNTDMAKYLRPETLFGTKFESYLNQVSKKNKYEAVDEWIRD